MFRQSCIFVHQNVPAADAENKMIEERQMFVETLDEMAKDVQICNSVLNSNACWQVLIAEKHEPIFGEYLLFRKYFHLSRLQ
jgi:hypothetical protein